MDPGSAERVVRAMADAWNRRDLDAYVEHLHEDVIWDDPAMPAQAVGRDAVREFAESVFRAFPDIAYEIRAPVCTDGSGTYCAVPWRIRATHSAPLDPPGYGPTMRTAEFDGVDLLEMREGRVVRIETFFNVIVPAEQFLGIRLLPAPGTFRAWLLTRIQRVVAWFTRTFRRPS